MEKNLKEEVVTASNQESNKNNAVKIIVLAIVIIATISILAGATSLGDKPSVSPEEVVDNAIDENEGNEETTTEPVVSEEEASNSQSSNNGSGSNRKGGTSVTVFEGHNDSEFAPTVSSESEATSLRVIVGRSNPTVNEYNDSVFGTIKVTSGNKDVTAACTIKINSDKVNTTKSGTYSVIIAAECGNYGVINYIGNVTLHIPEKDEAPKASSKEDTSSSSAMVEPEVDKKTGAEKAPTYQELTVIVLICKDGTQRTYNKAEVEDVYASQLTKVMVESELASNVKVSADYKTITIGDRIFNLA